MRESCPLIAFTTFQAPGERRLARRGPAPPAFLNPRRYRLKVGPGLPAQLRSAPGQRLIQLTLTGALEDPGYLGEQAAPAVRELAQCGHRSAFLVAGERPPLRPVPSLPRQLSYQNPVSLRAIIDHDFYSAG
jgi:hypothetical protein